MSEILPNPLVVGPDHPDHHDSLNVLLYIGLGMVAVGLVITFVGLGEKGFRTTELQMVGLGLVGGGVRVRPEPDYPSGNRNGTGFPFPVNRNRNGF